MASLVLGSGLAAQQLTPEETAAWRRIQPRVVMIRGGGPAVLIDPGGLFLAHRASVPSGLTFATTHSGGTLELEGAGVDNVTGMVLLRVKGNYRPTVEPARVLHYNYSAVQSANPTNSVKLLGVGNAGSFRAELTMTNRLGITGSDRRGMTLSELRFESPNQSVGGALLFTLEGHLAAVVAATLETLNQAPAASSGAFGSGGLGSAGMASRTAMAAPSFGPQAMTIGYSVTPDVLTRVVEGFLSPQRKVLHPALGVLCRDAVNGGAEIYTVAPNSAASEAGLRPGDVIISLNGAAIRSALDYTRVILRLQVGETVPAKVRRGRDVINYSITVGS